MTNSTQLSEPVAHKSGNTSQTDSVSESDQHSAAITPQDDQESLHVRLLLSGIADRNNFYKLADILEKQGSTDEAKSLRRIIFPESLAHRHQIRTREMVRPEESSGVERLCQFRQESIALAPPTNTDENRRSEFAIKSVESNHEYVDVIPNASVTYHGFNHLVCDESGAGIKAHSTPNGFILLDELDNHQTDCRKLSGNTLMLAHHSSANFYHWMYEILPKIGLLAAAGINTAAIDQVLVDDNLSQFHYQSLAALNIPKEKIVVLPQNKSRFRCDRLFVAPIIGRFGMAHSIRHLSWLRTAFLDKQRKQSAQPKIVIHRDVRGFVDQDKVYGDLQKRGYKVLDTADLDFLDQVTAFANAESVVGAHGAGLSSVVFCKPGTEVHECYGDFVHPCFWIASTLTGLKYHNYNSAHEASDTMGASRNTRKTPVRFLESWLDGL